MRIVVAGGSGLIGTALRASFERDGHAVVRLVRREPLGPAEVRWDPAAPPDPRPLDGADAMVNLAGAGIGDRRWNAAYRQAILDSRISAAGTLAAAAARAAAPPRVLLCASGIAYYGLDRGEEVVTEATTPDGGGFLPGVARAWERASAPAADAGVAVCHLRFGLALSRHGGALRRMLPLFRAGLGARFGSGRQFWSTVSLRDAARAVGFLLELPAAGGPYNVTGPDPVRNADFTQALGRALGRPARLRVPGWSLRLALGGVSVDALCSLRVVPDRLLAAGFRYDDPDLDSALRSALS